MKICFVKMLMEYAYPERRRSKKDLKRKRRYRVYKKGGRGRTKTGK